MIKRYMWSFAEKFGQGLFISDKGDYVKFEDYANLRKEMDLLQAEVERLNATAQPVSDGCKVPEGWKLVPIEPTEEMKKQFFLSDFSEWRSEHKDGLECYYHDNVMRIWRAMLAAAPGGQDS